MKYIFVWLALWVALAAQAYDGQSGDTSINSIRVYSSSQVLITVTQAANPTGCSDLNYIALSNADTESGKRIYAALLLAYAMGKKVNLFLTGCTGGGTTGWRMIEQVSVDNN